MPVAVLQKVSRSCIALNLLAALKFSALTLSILTFVSTSFCEAPSYQQLKQVSNSLGESSGISVVDLDTRAEVFSIHPNVLLAPASTLKLATSVAALHFLGSNFTFKTSAYLLAEQGKKLVLGIKGGGDPEFTTEQAYLFTRKLKLLGIKNIGKVILDSSALADPGEVRGQRAYQAGSSALSFNFNSIGVQICPGTGKQNLLASVQPLIWEDRTRIINDVHNTSGSTASVSLSFAGPDTIKASGTIGSESICVERYLSNQSSLATLGAYLKALLEGQGLGTDIDFSISVIPSTAKRLFEFESKPLSTLLVGLNHFSTNVSAEQIVAALGSDGSGESLSTANGVQKLTQFINKLGFKDIYLEDGSGLSRHNRISARVLTSILQFAWKEPPIRPFLEASLSILGESGTLKHRSETNGDYQVFAKSGTLDGVSSLAGYLHLKSGKSYAFSIIQNDIADLGRAHRIEEEILQKIAQGV